MVGRPGEVVPSITGVPFTESAGSAGQLVARPAAHSGTTSCSMGKNSLALEPSGVFSGALTTMSPLKPS